jgi:hypothetical protein
MTRVEHAVVVKGTPDRIDEFALRPDTWPDWYVGVQDAVPDSTYPNVGGKIAVKYMSAGARFDIGFTVIEFVKGQVIAYKLEGMINGTSRFTNTSQGDGTILITGTFEYELPGGGLGAIVDKLLVEKMNSDNLNSSLTNLKWQIEG